MLSLRAASEHRLSLFVTPEEMIELDDVLPPQSPSLGGEFAKALQEGCVSSSEAHRRHYLRRRAAGTKKRFRGGGGKNSSLSTSR